MTLGVRNTILRLGLIVSIGLLGAYGYWAYRILSGEMQLSALSVAAEQSWLLLRWETQPNQLLWAIGGLGFLGLFVPTTVSVLTRFFRKVAAPEMFFFVVFVLALSFDLFKLVHPLRHAVEFARVYSVSATRVVLFGHILGVFALFASSLYVAGVTYQKTGTALGFAALIAFALVYSIPVDSLTLLPNFVYQAGEERSLQIVVLVLQGLSVLNCAYGAFLSQDRGYLVLCLGLLLVIVGRQLLYYLASPTSIALGALLLLGGTALFVGKSRNMYLWL
jgi:hypothetical protein